MPMLDILRSDGALVLEDGSKTRATTGCKLGSLGDQMVTVSIGAGIGQIRFGTRMITADGDDISVMELVLGAGGSLTEDGLISMNGAKSPFQWSHSDTLSKPEDYVLQRSATTMQDIYQANEWEAVRPQMGMPVGRDVGAMISKHPVLVAGAKKNAPVF